MSGLKASELWQCGPDWLKVGETPSEIPDMPEECTTELKTTCMEVHNLATTQAEHTIGEIIDCRKYSSFGKLVRISAYF